MTAIIYGPFPAGSTGTVTFLNGRATASDDVEVHVFRGNVYYTVIQA